MEADLKVFEVGKVVANEETWWLLLSFSNVLIGGGAFCFVYGELLLVRLKIACFLKHWY